MKSKAITIRLSEDVYHWLNDEASKECRSLNREINKALDEYAKRKIPDTF